MADEPIINAAPAAPVSSPTPAPVVDITPAPVIAPEVSIPAPEPIVAPVVSKADAVEAPTPKADTVLGEALDKSLTPVVAPVVSKADAVEAPVPNTEGGQSAEPAPPPVVEAVVTPPVYEPFQVPDGVVLDPERSGKFTELLSGLELTGKADHAAVQEFGQKALDFHISEVNQVTQDLTKLYQTTWENQKTAWKDSTLKDPELGGNRIQTTIDSALTFIRTHGGTESQQKEFRDAMESSGLGNHPAVLRLLANAGRAMSEGKPLAATKPVQESKSRTETMYGRKS